MPLFLVMTIGGSPEPIVYSLLQAPRADRVLFLCSEQSRESLHGPAGVLARCAEGGFAIGAGQYDVFLIADPQNTTGCVEEFERRVSPAVARWRSQGEGYAVIVDATGGTKCMSMAAALAARRWPCTMRYIGGDERTKGGSGTVVTNRERRIDCWNPLETLGSQMVDDALTLAAKMDFAGARTLLRPGERVLKPSSRARVAGLERLLGLLADWDRFDHRAALGKVRDVEKNLDALRAVVGERRCQELERDLPRWEARLKRLADGEGPTRELVEDLLANARRRMGEGRFDDAAARMYRAVEALAQWKLKSGYGIDTGQVREDQAPAGFFSGPLEQPAKLGLQDAYKLLEALGDRVGQAFREAGLRMDGMDSRSPLLARNNSILAHGFTSVGERAAESLWAAAAKLVAAAGIEPTGKAEFPSLGPLDGPG